MSTYSNRLQPALQNLLQRVVRFFHRRSSCTTHISADFLSFVVVEHILFFHGALQLLLLLLLLLFVIFITLGRYIPEEFEKKNPTTLTNRYDTQSAKSNAGKQSWSRTALKRCNNTEIHWKRKHVSSLAWAGGNSMTKTTEELLLLLF